jgi:hypothetical protein
MAIVPQDMMSDAGASPLSLAEKVALVARNLPTAADYRAVAPLRALSFTRQAPGSMRDLPHQQAVFTRACAARGWSAGGSVGQIGGGLRAWSTVVRMVQAGRYDVVIVDRWERLASTEVDRLRVLWMLRRAGVRLLIAKDGIDTGERIGLALVDSLISAGAAAASR